MKKILIAVSVLTVLVLGCAKNNSNDQTYTCNYDSCATKAPAGEIQAVKDYLSANNIMATQHCSGMFYRVETPGTGTITPTPCSYLTLRYKGTLTNGNVFDETKGTNTISYYLGDFIKGWVNGVPYIKSGGKIYLYIPPSLGYGATDRKDVNGNVVIPANSILVFEVELVNVQ